MKLGKAVMRLTPDFIYHAERSTVSLKVKQKTTWHAVLLLSVFGLKKHIDYIIIDYTAYEL